MIQQIFSQTPLDELRFHLNHFSETDQNWFTRFLLLLQHLNQQALPELGARLKIHNSPKVLRRQIIATSQKMDWNEWVSILVPAMKDEPELSVFDDGCAAIGRLGTREAWDGLQEIAKFRTDVQHQTILNREIQLFRAQQPLSYYLNRLQEGESNTKMALSAMRILALGASAPEIPELQQIIRTGDLLARKLGLRVLAGLDDPTAAGFILHFIQENTASIVEEMLLHDLLERIPMVNRSNQKRELLTRLGEQLGPSQAPLVNHLMDAVVAENDQAQQLSLFLPLKRIVAGRYQTKLAEALEFLLEGKLARFNSWISEQREESAKNIQATSITLDLCADNLLRLVRRGLLDTDSAIEVLAAPFENRCGSEILDLCFSRLVQPGDQAHLEMILKEKDLKRRGFCLDAIGAREEDAFTPFFLKALHDPIVEVGEKAMRHLGKLPSSFQLLMEMFNSGHPDKIRQAIQVFKENRTRAAAESLLRFAETSDRDELVTEAIEALSAIRFPAGTNVLLNMLHAGQPSRLQVALAQALAQLHLPKAARGLLESAPKLKLPIVLILCLEGAFAAHPDFSNPLPEDLLPAVEQLIRRCCDEREGEGQRLPAILASEGLYCFDRPLYERLTQVFSDFLSEMRTKEDWDRDNNDKVSGVIKELTRRSQALLALADREARIRAQLGNLPDKGPRRQETLLTLKEQLQDPELILRREMAQTLMEFVLTELPKPGQDWRDIARLCDISGVIHQPELLDPIRMVFLHATGLGLKSAAREALLRMGLDETSLLKKPSVKSILVLEPSAFFRKRILTALQQENEARLPENRWQLAEAADRQGAELQIQNGFGDLLLTERVDSAGDLQAWIQSLWDRYAIRQVILSTSSRDLGDIPETPWFRAVLHKPYPMDQLFGALQD